MEVLPSVEVVGAPPVAVLVEVSDVSTLDVLTGPSLVVTVAALPPLELGPSLPVVAAAEPAPELAAELMPPADAALDVELLDVCPLPFELVVSVACSPDGLPPALQAHARTHANGLLRSQLMRVNFAPHRARRKQALIEHTAHSVVDTENRDHSGPNPPCSQEERVRLKFYWSVP